MFVLANFLMGIAKVLNIFLTLYMWVIIISALVSWVNPDPYNPIVKFLRQMTQPVLNPIRRVIPTHRWGVDISPIIAIALIIFLQAFVVQSLYQMAYHWQAGAPGMPGAPTRPTSDLPPL